MGTAHLLEAVRGDAGACASSSCVTTDKCYENREMGLAPIARTIRWAATILQRQQGRRRDRRRELTADLLRTDGRTSGRHAPAPAT